MVDLVILIRFRMTDEIAIKYAGTLEDGKLIITLYNHRSSADGVFTPIEIGFINDRKLYLTYLTNTLNEKENQRAFQFALYLGEKR